MSALNAWTAQPYCMTACPKANKFPRHGCMHDLTTERSLYLHATWIIDVLGMAYCLTFYQWVCVQQTLTDVRLNGAGIKCLYCRKSKRDEIHVLTKGDYLPE